MVEPLEPIVERLETVIIRKKKQRVLLLLLLLLSNKKPKWLHYCSKRN
jgi:hypothetical protein